MQILKYVPIIFVQINSKGMAVSKNKYQFICGKSMVKFTLKLLEVSSDELARSVPHREVKQILIHNVFHDCFPSYFSVSFIRYR